MNHSNSILAFKDAQGVIPGGVNSPVRAFGAVGGTPPFIARGAGAYIFDIDGNKYLDFVNSWGPLILGHSNAAVKEAVKNALDLGLGFGAPTLVETLLAKEILKIYSFLDKIRFVSSGTEAVMSAIRLARGYTQKEDIVKFKGCYHGHSDALLVEAGSGATTFGAPSSLGVVKDYAKHTLLADYNDIASVERCFSQSKDIACVVIEPLAGNMGFVPASEEFLSALVDLAHKNGALVIYDEVMSGFRAALNGVFTFTATRPDIVTFGKVIGGGLPVGAFGTSGEIMNSLSPLGGVYQAGTLSGNPVAMAAGLATLKEIQKDGVYAGLEKLAARLTAGLNALADKHGVAFRARHRGSMWGYFFNERDVQNFDDALKSDTKTFAAFHGAMLDAGVYLACSTFETGFVNTAMTPSDIDFALECADKAFGQLA
ncbi:MAG: glutamate-1-semialdehyde 2,1-aminomutase [Helicobacteraceae bacterium]